MINIYIYLIIRMTLNFWSRWDWFFLQMQKSGDGNSYNVYIIIHEHVLSPIPGVDYKWNIFLVPLMP